MGSREEILEQLGRYLEFMKQSGVEYVPRAVSTNAATVQERDEEPASSATSDTVIEPEVSTSSIGTEEGSPSDRLFNILNELGDCQLCSLGKTRTHLVFGVGNPNADLVFVGEAPGRDEDMKGEPFVGKAGQLLTKIIEAIDLKREDVYICNVIKCRPPENRNPLPEEIEACEPFLIKQIEVIKPKVICALGKFAAQTLLKTESPISALRGSFQDYHGVPLMPTYHPAFLLRNPKMKRQVWEDMQLIQKVLLGEVNPTLL